MERSEAALQTTSAAERYGGVTMLSADISNDCARETHEFCFWHGEHRADVIRCGCDCHAAPLRRENVRLNSEREHLIEAAYQIQRQLTICQAHVAAQAKQLAAQRRLLERMLHTDDAVQIAWGTRIRTVLATGSPAAAAQG